MSRHAMLTTLGFLLALLLAGAVTWTLEKAGVAEGWAIVAGWVVFLAAGTVLGRRLHPR